MNCVASPIPGWNFWLGVGANPWTFKYRGGSSNDDYKCTPFDLNKLKALKVSHTYSTPDNKTKAKIEVFIKLEGETDWTQIITTPIHYVMNKLFFHIFVFSIFIQYW